MLMRPVSQKMIIALSIPFYLVSKTMKTVDKGILKLTIECILSSECFNCTLY